MRFAFGIEGNVGGGGRLPGILKPLNRTTKSSPEQGCTLMDQDKLVNPGGSPCRPRQG